ncbi:SDR family oxidoreductase [Asanoa sp. WMMD1127]|uniref:SDR family oxidoreductase n=1 Tax=Asanoa sp. WMMD1127 TaxID=3016107 RepID=UPI002417C40F|nr:SDR family oxidoreductase [Asanoa sp. WMMD1127]MDG4822707.1 SDR family oxidoreductase [Asanoa sp. WMMD1127]
MTQIALITGANKGIGYATARALGERGMTVLVAARDADRGRTAAKELSGAGLDAKFVLLDVTDAATVRAAADLVEEEFGRLDVLVNNAGILRADGAAGEPSRTTIGTLREVFETNVYGVVTVTNAFLPLLRRAPAARIVNVSSEVGSITSLTDPASPLFVLTSVPYPASKAALNMITAMYAKELRDTAIKVNAANPGYTATDFNDHHGFRTPEQAAAVNVHLATLPADGPSGLLWGHLITLEGDQNGVLAW